MSIMVKCPHCQQMLLVEDQYAGTTKRCPSCQGLVDVPAKAKAGPVPRTRVRTCPHCGQPVALTAEECLHCHRDLRTGRKLPWRRRWALQPTSTKLTAGLIVLAAFIIGFAAGRWLWMAAATRPVSEPRVAETPLTLADQTAKELIGRILASPDPAEMELLARQLEALGPPAGAQIVAAWPRTSTQAVSHPLARGVLIRSLGATGYGGGEPLLRSLANRPDLAEEVELSLARLGCEQALAGVIERWSRLAEYLAWIGLEQQWHLATPARSERYLPAVLEAARQELDSVLADRLPEALPGMLRAFWSGWNWPLAERGQAVLTAIERVLHAAIRDGQVVTAAGVLEPCLKDPQAEVQLAAMVVLGRQTGGQRDQLLAWGEQIAGRLVDPDPQVRARCLWVLSKVFERQFEGFDAAQPPAAVNPNALQAALRWARQRWNLQLELNEAVLAESAAAAAPNYHRRRAEPDRPQ